MEFEFICPFGGQGSFSSPVKGELCLPWSLFPWNYFGNMTSSSSWSGGKAHPRNVGDSELLFFPAENHGIVPQISLKWGCWIVVGGKRGELCAAGGQICVLQRSLLAGSPEQEWDSWVLAAEGGVLKRQLPLALPVIPTPSLLVFSWMFTSGFFGSHPGNAKPCGGLGKSWIRVEVRFYSNTFQSLDCPFLSPCCFPGGNTEFSHFAVLFPTWLVRERGKKGCVSCWCWNLKLPHGKEWGHRIVLFPFSSFSLAAGTP